MYVHKKSLSNGRIHTPECRIRIWSEMMKTDKGSKRIADFEERVNRAWKDRDLDSNPHAEAAPSENGPEGVVLESFGNISNQQFLS